MTKIKTMRSVCVLSDRSKNESNLSTRSQPLEVGRHKSRSVYRNLKLRFNRLRTTITRESGRLRISIKAIKVLVSLLLVIL